MTRIYAVFLIRSSPDGQILYQLYNVEDFSFIYRTNVKEFLRFFAKTTAERIQKGIRQTVTHEKYNAHVHKNVYGLSCVVITDQEYPQNTAFLLISRLFDQFSLLYSREKWVTLADAIASEELDNIIFKFYNPNEGDPILKVRKEIDETKEVLHSTIDALLTRGEKLDDLVAKSDQLGAQSKAFFKQAKKTNSCCSIQ